MRWTGHKDWINNEKVHRLVTDRDLAGRSRSPEEFPAYHDPIIQLVGVVAALISSLVWSMTTEGVPHRISQALVLGSCLLGVAILLRSVRNGWNVSVYRRARRALLREATLRTERNALREVSLRCASARRDGSAEDALSALQGLTTETHRVLEKSAPKRIALVVVEEVEGRFLVFCAAGFIRGKPFHVAPQKRCRADRPFSQLLYAFAPEGQVAIKEVDNQGRRYWIGLASEDAEAKIDQGALDTLAAWVSLMSDMGLIPKKVFSLRGAA
jgi:hypothetical protein